MQDLKTKFFLKVGTDITNVLRIEKLVNKFGINFLQKILTQEEITYCSKNNVFNINSIAKRFAGKEAMVKALGTGFSKEISFQDIQIINNIRNKPQVILSDRVNNYIITEFKVNVFDIDISLSDDNNFAIAVVTLLGYNV
ncbi:holo-ACP synthase [Rickettsiales bacterium LUAb2]